MTPKTVKKLEEFFRAFTSASRPLLLLDYDGTLAGFRVDRFKARPWACVRELLTGIQREGRTRMAVITGRPPEEIAPMLALDPPLEVWGLHGAERLRSGGRREQAKIPAGARRKLDEVRARLRQDALGGLYEDKPNAAVVHWRGHAPAKARQIEQRTRALFEPLARLEGLTLLEFEAGLELRGGRDKGGAVRELLREHARGAPCTYLGDDVTDEEAFRAINQAAAPHLSVLVRRARRKTAADVWLRPPEDLRGFLRMWLDALKMSAAAPAGRGTRTRRAKG
ncbi:MAG TPA: trehalose-phosphatase [Terracidiphilus sp.]|nr:trehalose-phosphatase [Terracidiphilus sp.]